ncbi:MAG: glutathione S-transferase family protein [Gammaproteobacteria bacterium]|nr:glutathione S-transferase family protein [Gammaproteobacteria bacterium]
MKLYHCTGSRSTRVLWMLEELGVEYELETLPFDPKALQSADYLELSPFGKVPVLIDDAVTMFESVAIIQYLLEHYADERLEPPRKSPEYGKFLQWMHFGEATLMGPVAQVAMHSMLLPESERQQAFVEAGQRSFRHYATSLEKALQGQTYIVDDTFTAADVVIGYTLHVARQCGLLSPELANLHAYYERLAARPAFKKATAA